MSEQMDRINDAVRMAESERKSAATVLVEMAMEHYEFGMSTVGETFARPKSGPKVISLLRASKSSLRSQLAKLYFQRNMRAAPQQALADALLVVEGLAQEAEESDVYLRVARRDDLLWLDLGDQSGRAINVTSDGWCIEPQASILFKRTVLNDALPEPSRQGNLEDLRRFLNVTETDRPLVAAWLVAALFNEIPHPVLAFFGEQGTGKTTAQRILVTAIDPSPVPTRKPPRDPESWVTAAAGSWVVGLDNLSDISPWLSDSICRAVTGDGDVRRKLYTDGEHAVFAYRRCICLNSIDLGASRGDLGDRMLPITLEVIPEQNRLGEEEIWPLFKKAHASILGGLLDLASDVLKVLPSVELARKPRMADFAKILAAVDSVLGTDGLALYLSRQNALARDSLTGDTFITAIEARVNDSSEAGKQGAFVGTAAELLDLVSREKPPRDWPTHARAVTQRLRRQAPVMRKAGWIIEDDGGCNARNAAIWTLIPPPREAGNPSSYTSSTRLNGGSDEVTSQTSQECRPSQDAARLSKGVPWR